MDGVTDYSSSAVLPQVIINFNALPWLLNLLSSSKKGIRKEACWTISNITAGNKEQIQAVIEATIIPPLIQLLSNAEFDIRKVCAKHAYFGKRCSKRSEVPLGTGSRVP